MALFEFMVMNESLAEAIVNNLSLGDLRARAQESGLRSLRDAGILAVFDGLTTPEEVVRETLISW
jgi:type IV pilus assembly protein PilB